MLLNLIRWRDLWLCLALFGSDLNMILLMLKASTHFKRLGTKLDTFATVNGHLFFKLSPKTTVWISASARIDDLQPKYG